MRANKLSHMNGPTNITKEWDSATYDVIANPMAKWGTRTLDLLVLRGNETVLDAGCGSGRVTELLAERLPRGHVIALDASSSMIARARQRLDKFSPRITFLQADLIEAIPLPHTVDAIFSTATFHWILDHDTLFTNLAAVLRPGGQLVAQCGGSGNLDNVGRAVERAGEIWGGHHYFAGPEETAERLEKAGFVNVKTWLTEEPTQLEPGEPLKTYLATIVLRSHLASMADEEKTKFLERVAAELPDGKLDYVRLNIIARKGN